MSLVTVGFKRLLQDSQDLGSDDDHMVSRVSFEVECEGQKLETHADIKQVVGSKYGPESIEVGPPVGWRGPFDHEAFRKAVTNYMMRAVSVSGSVAGLIRMRNNVFVRSETVTFEGGSRPAGW